MNKEKMGILIYEDNNDFRDALHQLISTSDEFTCVGDFRNCLDIVQHVETLHPSVILMDIDMPGMTGIEGLRKVRLTDKDVKVIILTVFDDNKHVIEAILSGASGYLLKKNCLNRLFDAIDDVLKGGAPMSSAVARMVLDFVAQGSPQPVEEFGLTTREKEVLGLLVEGFSYKMIAGNMQVGIETIKTHIRNIYDKLHVHNQSEAVAKALKNRIVR